MNWPLLTFIFTLLSVAFALGYWYRGNRLNAIHLGAIKEKDHKIAQLRQQATADVTALTDLRQRLEAAQRNLSPRN